LLLTGTEDVRFFGAGIDQPDFLSAGSEVLGGLALNVAIGVRFRDDFDRDERRVVLKAFGNVRVVWSAQGVWCPLCAIPIVRRRGFYRNVRAANSGAGTY